MQREYPPFDNSHGHEPPQPEQRVAPLEWSRSPMNAQPAMPHGSPAQPKEAPPPQISRRPAGSGLLSNWKSAQLQQGQSSAVAPNSVGPVRPPQPQGPITDPSHNQQNVQSFLAAPVSPHQSGINAIPTLFSGTNSSQGANGQQVPSQQGPNTQNVSPWQPSPLQQGPNTQNVSPFQQSPSVNAIPFTAQQPANGQIASPFNPSQSPFTNGQRQPYQYPGSPALSGPNQASQVNAPFGTQVAPGQPMQPQNPWQQRQMQPAGPVGPTNGGFPPGMVGAGGNGQGGNKKANKKKRRFPIWARVVVAVLMVLIIVVSTGFIYYQLNFASAVNGITNQQVSRISGEENPNSNRDPNNILSGGRLNILLLGSDTDQKFAGVYLSQTDIVVTINPSTGSVAMLSIPRDTWLHAAQSSGADNGMMKLDQTYGRGGIANTRATIEQDFGIPINYYAWVGLDGFIKVIDTVGGIDVDILHPVTDYNYPDDVGNTDAYAYKRLDLAPGPQHLDGPTALEYVRSRHADLVGDFGRSARQQQILSQLKTKLQNPGIIGQLPAIANDLNGYVKTDMALPQVFQLMNFARTINQSAIKQVILDGSYSRTVNSYQTSYGPQDIVVLNCGTVQPLIAQLFALGNKAQCNTGISYNGTPQPVASASHSTPQAIATTGSMSTNNVADIWQTFGEIANLSKLSMNQGFDNQFGLRSLLDLLCFVTFESPIGLQL